MQHLKAEELKRWVEEGDPAERERILSHLAQCDRCGTALVEIVRTEPALAGATRLDVRAFVEAGNRLGPKVPEETRSRWIWAPALAAAIVLVSLALPLFQEQLLQPEPSSRPAMRGAAMELLSPVGEVEMPFEFRWTETDSDVLIEVFDAQRKPLFSHRTSGNSLAIPDALKSELVVGDTFYWMATRLDPSGQTTASSALQSFTVRLPD